MREIQISSIDGWQILEQLNNQLNGKITEQWGESVLEFDGEYGSGVIRSISFDWGISLVDYDVNFKEDTKIIFSLSEVKPIEFIFISEGNLEYSNSHEQQAHTFERYQNIIISPEKHSKEVYVFPKNVSVRVNFIYVVRKEYQKKKNNNLLSLDDSLLKAFDNAEASASYNHFGNFSLKIADQIKQLQEGNGSGIVRTLSIEGQLNLIMAQQMLEHANREESDEVTESIGKNDIKKIHDLSAYIVDHMSEPLTISVLSEVSGLSAKKLQSGFKVLYAKSVNEYIRHLKLEVSRDYIKNTDDSISEIVYKIGLKSRSYFSKIFFERYGMLPVEYRKKGQVKN